MIMIKDVDDYGNKDDDSYKPNIVKSLKQFI